MHKLNEKQVRDNHHLLFVKSFLKSPVELGSAIPSSRFLAECMVAKLNLQHSRVVVEYGPGTGAVTRSILNRIGPDTAFFALETNPDMCEIFQRRFPGVRIINDSAEHVGKHLEALKLGTADYIISSLPFALIKPEVCNRIIFNTHEALRAGGEFVTYQYVHSRILTVSSLTRVHMRNSFKRVDTTVILRNIPPAFVFRCIK